MKISNYLRQAEEHPFGPQPQGPPEYRALIHLESKLGHFGKGLANNVLRGPILNKVEFYYRFGPDADGSKGWALETDEDSEAKAKALGALALKSLIPVGELHHRVPDLHGKPFYVCWKKGYVRIPTK